MSVVMVSQSRSRLVNELAPSMREMVLAIGHTLDLQERPSQLAEPMGQLEHSVEHFLDAVEQQLDAVERYQRLNGLLAHTRTLLGRAAQVSDLDGTSRQALRHLDRCLHTYLAEVGEED